MSIWGCEPRQAKPAITLSIREGTSFKRISPSLTSRDHPIACFPNTQHCIIIEATSIGRYLSAYSTNTDFMSFVVAARCFGLLKYACSGVRSAEIPFAILPGHLPVTDESTYHIDDENSYSNGLARIQMNTLDIFEEAVKSSLISKEVAVDEDEVVQTIEYSVGTHTERKKVSSIKIQPGLLLQEVTGSFAVELPRRIRGPMFKVVGEELRHTHGHRFQTIYRKFAAKMGPSQALVNSLIVMVSQQFKRVIPKSFIVARWIDMGNVLVKEFPGWADVWKNVCNAARTCKTIIDDEVVKSLFGYFDFKIKQAFKFLDPKPSEETATVLGVLYMVGHGRFPTAETYTLTSGLGPKHIAKCWRMASLRKRLLRKDTNLNNDIMSRVYSSLAAQAEAYSAQSSTKNSVLLGAHNAILSYLESLDEGSSNDILPVHSHFLVIEGERKRYYSSVHKTISRIVRSKRFDLRSFTYDMENIVKDIIGLGAIHQVGANEEVYAPLVDPVSQAPDIYHPEVVQLEIDITLPKEGIEETQESDLHMRKVVSAYLVRGATGVAEFMKGEFDIDPCKDEEVDLYEDAMNEYNFWLESRDEEDPQV
jgi:hypothetical protein